MPPLYRSCRSRRRPQPKPEPKSSAGSGGQGAKGGRGGLSFTHGHDDRSYSARKAEPPPPLPLLPPPPLLLPLPSATTAPQRRPPGTVGGRRRLGPVAQGGQAESKSMSPAARSGGGSWRTPKHLCASWGSHGGGDRIGVNSGGLCDRVCVHDQMQLGRVSLPPEPEPDEGVRGCRCSAAGRPVIPQAH